VMPSGRLGRYLSSFTPLAATEVMSELQAGDADVQGAVIFNTSIPERTDSISCSCLASTVILRPAVVCPKNINQVCAEVFVTAALATI